MIKSHLIAQIADLKNKLNDDKFIAELSKTILQIKLDVLLKIVKEKEQNQLFL